MNSQVYLQIYHHVILALLGSKVHVSGSGLDHLEEKTGLKIYAAMDWTSSHLENIDWCNWATGSFWHKYTLLDFV